MSESWGRLWQARCAHLPVESFCMCLLVKDTVSLNMLIWLSLSCLSQNNLDLGRCKLWKGRLCCLFSYLTVSAWRANAYCQRLLSRYCYLACCHRPVSDDVSTCAGMYYATAAKVLTLSWTEIVQRASSLCAASRCVHFCVLAF